MSSHTEITIGAPRYPVLNAFMGCRARVSAIAGPPESRAFPYTCKVESRPELTR